jgi:hypothetical protein
MRGPYAQPSALPQADFAYDTKTRTPKCRHRGRRLLAIADEVIE